MVVSTQSHGHAYSCRSYCGNLTVDYSFALQSRCGHPGYRDLLFCINDVLMLHISSDSYRILDIDYAYQSLALDDPHMSTCGAIVLGRRGNNFVVEPWPATYVQPTSNNVFMLLGCSAESQLFQVLFTPLLIVGILLRDERDADVDGCGSCCLGSPAMKLCLRFGFHQIHSDADDFRVDSRNSVTDKESALELESEELELKNIRELLRLVRTSPRRRHVYCRERERLLERRPAAGMGDKISPLSPAAVALARPSWRVVVTVFSSPSGMSSEHQWRQVAFFYVNVSDD
nr:uncharacterized protein LOC109149295 isoform X2 [Ipomoea trifida]